jgi:hypothetical protein
MWVNNRVVWMHQALALNDGFGKPNVQFSVIMEMREGFPAEDSMIAVGRCFARPFGARVF